MCIPSPRKAHSNTTDLLILGAGWTSQFLIPLLSSERIDYAYTTRDGRDSSIKFQFDQDADHEELVRRCSVLPEAKTVLVTFPIYGNGGATKLFNAWRASHKNDGTLFIQLGSTGIYDGGPTLTEKCPTTNWVDRHSPYDKDNKRAQAEDEWLSLSNPEFPVCILELSGLWGGERSMRNFVNRVVKDKDSLRKKCSVHMIHGLDVSRAVVAVHQHHLQHHKEEKNVYAGQRYILNDGRVYDWWDLASSMGTAGIAGRGKPAEGDLGQWVLEFMHEEGIRALPRPRELMKRAIDSSEFWRVFGLVPVMGRVD